MDSFFGTVVEKSRDLSLYFKKEFSDLKSVSLRIALSIIAVGALQRLKQSFPQMTNRFSQLQITLLSISLLKPLCFRILAIYFNCDKGEIDQAIRHGHVQTLKNTLSSTPPSLEKYAMVQILQAGKPELLNVFSAEIYKHFSVSERITIVSNCSLKICGVFGDCSIGKINRDQLWDVVVQKVADGTLSMGDGTLSYDYFYNLSNSAKRVFIDAVRRDVDTLFPLIYRQAMDAKCLHVLDDLIEVLYRDDFSELSPSIQQKVIGLKLERDNRFFLEIPLKYLLEGDENSHKLFRKALEHKSLGRLSSFKNYLDENGKTLSIPEEFWVKSDQQTLGFACIHFSPIPEHIRDYALGCLLDNTWNPSPELVQVLQMHEYLPENSSKFTLDQQSVYWTLYNSNIEKLREVISEKNLTTILENYQYIDLNFICEVFRLVKEKYPSNFNKHANKYISSRFCLESSGAFSLDKFEEVFNKIASIFSDFSLSVDISMKVIKCLIDSQSFKPVGDLLAKNLKVVFSESTGPVDYEKNQFYFWTFFSPDQTKISNLLMGRDIYYGRFPPIFDHLADQGLIDRIDWYKSYIDAHFLALTKRLHNDQCIEKILSTRFADLSHKDIEDLFTGSINFNLLCQLITPSLERNYLTAKDLEGFAGVVNPIQELIICALDNKRTDLPSLLKGDPFEPPDLERLVNVLNTTNPESEAISTLKRKIAELEEKNQLVKCAAKLL